MIRVENFNLQVGDKVVVKVGLTPIQWDTNHQTKFKLKAVVTKVGQRMFTVEDFGRFMLRSGRAVTGSVPVGTNLRYGRLRVFVEGAGSITPDSELDTPQDLDDYAALIHLFDRAEGAARQISGRFKAAVEDSTDRKRDYTELRAAAVSVLKLNRRMTGRD